MKFRTGLFIAVGLFVGAASFAQGDTPTFRRFGLYIGSNNGGHSRTTLSYASSDANAMAEVMRELGAVEDEDTILVYDPTASVLENSFRQINQKVASARRLNQRAEFLLYYSGHSDEDGLLLGDQRVLYSDLRKEIDSTNADVKIAILDSCSSGAFTRLKGGTRKQPFVLDESVTTSGYAFLTSSSADEASQESDRIGASFFTYYFVSALRGAADNAQDGKVTLNEAYSYASSETLARTTNTEAGPQHPAYEIRLSGSGDLVLTDLRETTAAIVLDETLKGRVYLRDSSGRLVTEVRKLAGVEMSLSLPSGEYGVDLEEDSSLRTAKVVLRTGLKTHVGDRSFTSVARESTRIRGSSDEPLVHVNGFVSLFPMPPFFANRRVVQGLSIVSLDDSYEIDGAQIGLASMVQHDVRGAQIAAVYNTSGGIIDGVQASGVFSIGGGEVRGAQVAGVFNVASGDVSGLQASGVFNVARGSSRWIQSAGVFNINDGDFEGVQSAGVFNVASGRVHGGQASGAFNIASESLNGVQASGAFNIAGETSGVQLSVVNVSGDLRGGQGAVVNIAGDVRGVQVGVVNICRNMYGIPIGLINISKNGMHDPSIWADGAGYGYLGYQLGSGMFYTLGYAGVPFSGDGRPGAFGIGLGIHNAIGDLTLDLDASMKRPVSYDPAIGIDSFGASFGSGAQWQQAFPSARIAVGVGLFHRVSLIGGLTVDGYIPGYTEKSAFHTGTPWVIPVGGDAIPVELYPQWFIGVRL